MSTLKGKIIQAIEVTQHEAVGVATLNELEHFGIKSPAEMAKTPIAQISDKPDFAAKTLRLTMQRAWDKSRHGRADLYKQYLLNLWKGTIIGAAPPITVYIDGQGKANGDGTIQFPYQSSAIAVDGETQLEARFRLRTEVPETGDKPFSITLHHGNPEEHGIQILHDYNRYAHPIPESKLGVRNSTGGMSHTIASGIEKAKAVGTIEAINKTGNTGTKKHIASYRQAMSFVAAFGVGQDALKRNATSWFDALNSPGSEPVNGGCDLKLAEMLDLAAADQRVSLAPPIIWQVAGVLGAEGRAPASLKWDDGFAAYTATAPKGPGKNKISARLAAIYTALN